MTTPPGSAFLFGHGFSRVLPLAGLHIELGCHPGPAFGFTVPLWYEGTLEEQAATRARAGLFDRSHLGQYYVTGERAEAVLGAALATDPARIPLGGMSRAVACREDGAILDLPLLAHLDEGRWLLLTGPTNGGELAQRIEALGATQDVLVHDRSMATVLLSLQGPQARLVAAEVLGETLVESVPAGSGREFLLALHRAAMLGYSDVGTDGLLFAVQSDMAADLWRAFLGAGATSAGLAAHDALRLEAGVLEAPHETPRPATPAACGLEALVHLEGADGPRAFPGAEALRHAPPPERRLVALRLDGPRLAKRGSRIFAGGGDIGAGVAASWSSLLHSGLVLAYLPASNGPFEVDCDGVRQPATPVALPVTASPS